MNLDDLIESIYALAEEIKQYEQKYGLASAEFYQLYSQGELDDGEYEETEDFSLWAGLHEIKIDRELQFHDLSREKAKHMKRVANSDTLRLMPRRNPVGV